MLDIVIALEQKKKKTKNKYELKTDCMIVYIENPKESTNHVVKLCLLPSYNKNNLTPSYNKRYMQKSVVYSILTTNRWQNIEF